MQTNLLWTGRQYYSLENCLVTTADKGTEINSTIVGKYQGMIYRVEYVIKTNSHWETLFVEIHSQHSNQRQHLILESDGNGNWLMDRRPADQFRGCIDVDIPLTPFTNTLPINRLKFAPGGEYEIQVLYIDLLGRMVTPVKQKYVRISEKLYHYENVPNDFEANIEVDELGFVTDYPLLFTRTARLATHYPPET
jgi:hypothetical protein